MESKGLWYRNFRIGIVYRVTNPNGISIPNEGKDKDLIGRLLVLGALSGIGKEERVGLTHGHWYSFTH